MMISAYGLSGLGAAGVTQANPNAGTYDDINCPTRCYLAGNLLDTALFGATCWPCHNVCPAGTVWDNASEQCSAAPAQPNAQVPVTELPQCPSGASWDAQTSACVSDSVNLLGTYLPWIVGLAAAAIVLPAVLGRR